MALEGVIAELASHEGVIVKLVIAALTDIVWLATILEKI